MVNGSGRGTNEILCDQRERRRKWHIEIVRDSSDEAFTNANSVY